MDVITYPIFMQVTGRVLENEAFKAKCARICKRSPARKRPGPGARPTKHISIEFEIRWKFKTL